MQTPQGVDLLAPQEFPLGPAEQETVALEVMIPDPPPAEFRLLVTAFNNFSNRQTAIFLGQVLLQRGQESAALTLVRNPDPATLIPVVATPASLQQTVFPFLDGAVFGCGLGGVPVTLTTGSFQGNGLDVDDSSIEINNSNISGNTGTDVTATFGTRLSLNGTNTIGALTCDGTVLKRVNGTLGACP